MRQDGRQSELAWSELERYLAGEIAPAEFERLVPDAETRRRLEAARGAIAGRLGGSRGEASDEMVWAAFTRRVAEVERRDVVSGGDAQGISVLAGKSGRGLDGVSHVMRRGGEMFAARVVRRVMWSAVVGVLVVVAGWILIGRRPHGARGDSTTMLTYTTGNGQRANITLPDGSTVALDVASRLAIPADYAKGDHTVRLVGEALFTVSHHNGTPLSVMSGGATARVLGTSFVVRHYPGDTMTTVAVREGKVAVGDAVVTASRMVDVERDGVMQSGVVDSSMFGFASGVLSLRAMPLSAAIEELNRWYDADIQLKDPALAALQIKGDFVAGSRSDLAELLALTFRVRVVRDGRVLSLYSKTGE